MSSARQRSPSACRFSAKRSSRSPIRQFATAALSEAVWSTPIRRRNCRCSPSPWTATFHLRSARASRSVAAKDFYQGYLLTDIAPDELLVAIDFRLPPVDCGWCCTEIARRHGDFAIVAVAVLLGCGRDQMNRLRARRAWRSRSGAAPHDRSGRGALGRAAWRRSFSPRVRPCGASGGSAGRHPRFFGLPAPSHRRVGAPRLGNCGKSDQRAGVMTEMISITFKVNGSEQIGVERIAPCQRTVIAQS